MCVQGPTSWLLPGHLAGVFISAHLVSVVSCQSLFQRLLLQDPVIHEVKVETLSDKRLSEHGYHLLIVGPLLKLELSRVAEEVAELARVPLGQVFDARYCFLYFNLLVLFFF